MDKSNKALLNLYLFLINTKYALNSASHALDISDSVFLKSAIGKIDINIKTAGQSCYNGKFSKLDKSENIIRLISDVFICTDMINDLNQISIETRYVSIIFIDKMKKIIKSALQKCSIIWWGFLLRADMKK